MSEESIEAVKAYLDQQGIDYELVEHEERFTAAAEAQASGVEPGDAAKDLILRDGESYALAVIPALERLDLGKARELLEASGSLRLATEEEIGRDFERFAVGAIPPFGGLHGIPQVIDRRLLEHDRVLCSAGDHAHGVLVDPKEMVRIADARTGDLCEE
ncbi:MAG TPA: YbaK/EbsC family protein [Candidatus Acidoferrum sp.]|nr:YbaK/EbsC family protein [Candidatus Acidoferrum sp.]